MSGTAPIKGIKIFVASGCELKEERPGTIQVINRVGKFFPHLTGRRWGQVKAPIKTGRRQKVKVLYCEDLANHTSPESCGGDGNMAASG